MTHLKLKFHIDGNQEDPEGNAIPYTRTLKQSYTPAGKRYFKWCDYVRHCFLKQQPKVHGQSIILDDTVDQEIVMAHMDRGYIKPINLKKHIAKVNIVIQWRDNKHGDADNVFKGILDSLFIDDKCVVAGSFMSGFSSTGKGRVDIEIIIAPQVEFRKPNKK